MSQVHLGEDLKSRMAPASVPALAFEYYPPRSAEAVEKLYSTIEEMKKKHSPLYIDFTWGAGGSTSDLTLELAIQAQERFGVQTNMHLTCTNMEADKITHALAECKKAGVKNIVALRGDPPKGQEEWTATEGGFTCALDLVRHIREEHGDYFCISVAGYPEGHPNRITKVEDPATLSEAERGRLVHLEDGDYVCRDEDFKKEIAYLKEKVDAGANFIITQLFYCLDTFFAFVDACREAGINVPIMPGIMPVVTYGGFKRMTTLCKTRVPPSLADKVAALAEDEEGLKKFGVELAASMSKAILEKKCCPGLHIYALNKSEATDAILGELTAELTASA